MSSFKKPQRARGTEPAAAACGGCRREGRSSAGATAGATENDQQCARSNRTVPRPPPREVASYAPPTADAAALNSTQRMIVCLSSTGLCGGRASPTPPARCTRQPAGPRLVTSHARRVGVCRYRHSPPPPATVVARSIAALSRPPDASPPTGRAPPARAARCVRVRLACAGSLRTAPAFMIAPSVRSACQRLSRRLSPAPLLLIPSPKHRLGLRYRPVSTPSLSQPRCESWTQSGGTPFWRHPPVLKQTPSAFPA